MNEYRIGNVIVIVNRPQLEEKERAKREDRGLIALHQFGKAAAHETR